jgi:hypothetical protein
MQFVPVKPFDFLRVSATLTEISASTALSCHEVIAREMNMSKQMGMSKEMSMPKEINMSSHGGATLLTLSNYPLQVRLPLGMCRGAFCIDPRMLAIQWNVTCIGN